MKSYKEKLDELNRIKRLKKKVVKEMRYDILNAYRECLLHEKKYVRLLFTYLIAEDYRGMLDYIPKEHPLFIKYKKQTSLMGWEYIHSVWHPEIKIDPNWDL